MPSPTPLPSPPKPTSDAPHTARAALIAAAAGAGVVFLTANLLAGGTPVYSAHNNNEVEIAALYWHFVDLIWILVFTFVYLI